MPRVVTDAVSADCAADRHGKGCHNRPSNIFAVYMCPCWCHASKRKLRQRIIAQQEVISIQSEVIAELKHLASRHRNRADMSTTTDE